MELFLTFEFLMHHFFNLNLIFIHFGLLLKIFSLGIIHSFLRSFLGLILLLKIILLQIGLISFLNEPILQLINFLLLLLHFLLVLLLLLVPGFSQLLDLQMQLLLMLGEIPQLILTLQLVVDVILNLLICTCLY